MRKKLYSLTFIIIMIFIIINMFINSTNITTSILTSIDLFINNVFPSLFPMFVISNLLVAIGVPEFFGSIFNKIMYKLFNIKGEGSFVFFMSMITGFPSSAKYIKDLLDKNIIDDDEATQLLTFTFFSNPLFIINTIGIMFFNNIKIGYYILISHILGNIIIGLIVSKLFKKRKFTVINKKDSLRKLNYNINNTNIFKILLNGIKSSLNTLVMIFGIITTFLVIGTIIDNNIDISIKNNALIKGIMEMTSGVKYVSLLNIKTSLKVMLTTFFISFGGLSIHTQIMNILSESKIKYGPFLLARIFHGIISSVIVLIISRIYGLF